MTVAEWKAILGTLPNDAKLWIFASPHYVDRLKEAKYITK